MFQVVLLGERKIFDGGRWGIYVVDVDAPRSPWFSEGMLEQTAG